MLVDASGHEYFDGLSSLWNVNLGHGRRELAEAASAQMATLAYTSAYTGYSNRPAIELAARIMRVAYPNLSGVYFTTAGAESNETAFKIARYYWKVRGHPQKVKIISRIHGYHGVTMAAMSATGMPAYHRMFAPLVPGFIQIPAPYPYRWPTGSNCGEAAAQLLEEAILREEPETVAAFIAEPVIGAGGVIVPPPEYFPRVRAICDRHGVLFIADEIITGFGRTGHWFALDHWGVVPDIMTFAKGITSGYLPLGGALVSQTIHHIITDAPPEMRFMHASTYSGHATCCAVGLATMEIMEREDLIARLRTLSGPFQADLRRLEALPTVGEVRGIGLLGGIELVRDKRSKEPAIGLGAKVLKAARERGLLTRIRTGSGDPTPIGDTICLAPPFVSTPEQLHQIIEVLAEAIQVAGP
jgi:adenosylmethionine-8-amino-7-oxononanoate aminotransferase